MNSKAFANLPHMIFSTAGEQAPALKRSMLLGCITAALRGLVFACFIPLFYAVAAHDGRGIVTWLIVMTILMLIASVGDWYSRDYDYNGHAARAGNDLRHQLGQHLRRIPLQDLYRSRSGNTAATIAGNVDDVINYTMTVSLMLVAATVTPTVVALVAMFFDWRLGLALLILFPAVIPIYLWVRPMMTRHKAEQAAASSHLNAETVEYTQGLPVLKAATCVGDKSARFISAAKAVEDLQIKSLRDEAVPNLLLASAIEIGMLLVVALGLWQVSHGDISLMLLAALMVAIIRFAEPLSVFLSMMSIFEMVHAGHNRLQDLRDIEPLPQAQPVQTPSQYHIDFRDLSFTYAGQSDTALDNINLHIPANALTALVGPSGCGKTTLIRMLMRYADPQQGSVSIGGIDIRHIEPETLNRLIAVVFQDVYLFDDTILANIRMGRADASEADIIAAAKAAQCHDFIERLPDGYQTRVGDIGNNLSGGEKQRISIARALLKNAPIIILDEPTAALDTHSELAVQHAIDALVQNKTVIVIAHRLSTTVAARQIIVLDNSQLIEQDSHSELLNQNGRYAKLWHAQQMPQEKDK